MTTEHELNNFFYKPVVDGFEAINVVTFCNQAITHVIYQCL